MSSASKTQYLQLNQWVDTDPVMRVDFNADNQKLDDALGVIPYRRVLDLVTMEPTSQLDLDLGRSIGEFQELNIVLSGFKHAYNETSLFECNLLLQDLTTTYRTLIGSNYSTELHRFIVPPKAYPNQFSHIKMMPNESSPLTNPMVSCHCLSVYSTGAASTSDKYNLVERFAVYCNDPTVSGSLPLEQINTINIVPRNANCLIQPGAHVKIWGQLK